MIRRLLCSVILLLAWSPSLSSEANLSWTEPTQNEDGSLLTDLASYEIHYGCTQSGVYGSVETLNAPATAYTVLGLPDNGACYFAAKAVNSEGTASAYSNEATRVFGSLEVPGPVVDTAITWRESQAVSFGYTGGSRNSGNSAAPDTGVHGVSINSSDLVVVYVNSNSTTAISADAGGTTFNEVADEQPSGETARHALYWKIAGASEPNSYSFTAGNAEWGVIIKVFSSATDAEVDTLANTHVTTVNQQDMSCGAADGEVINDNVLSVIFGGKDDRGSATAYTTVDNSYTGVIGDRTGQASAGAHRIYTTGHSSPFSGEIDIDVADTTDGMNDKTYSIHISFVESAAGGGAPENFLTLLGVGH